MSGDHNYHILKVIKLSNLMPTTTTTNLTEKSREMLPMDETGLIDCKATNASRKQCFLSGDMR